MSLDRLASIPSIGRVSPCPDCFFMSTSTARLPLSALDQPLISPIETYLSDLYDRLLTNTDGKVASYIPELSSAPPDGFGICVATMDGKLYTAGEASTAFTIQSMSKPFTYGYALKKLGREAVLHKVGVEPTGEAFNSIILDDQKNRPFNPMVNAGAIAVANLLIDKQEPVDVVGLFSRFAGRDLAVDDEVLRSEHETGHRNRAIAYMMLNTGMIDHDPETVLDFYFRQCSVLVNCQDMALMAATLANLGHHPVTDEEVLEPDHVKDVLTLMNTCGMYNYAGQWAYEVGIPAKSGVAGGVIAVIPGQAGIAVWSPPLDPTGNSVRGVEVCRAISRDFGLHAFAEKASTGTVIRRHFTASQISSKRIRSASEREWLQKAAGRVHVLELQGTLYFGSTETVIRQLSKQMEDAEEIIIDFSRASYTDAAAARLLTQAFATFRAGGCRLVLSGLRADGPVAALRQKIVSTGLDVSFVDDVDSALEDAEGRLLAEHYEQADTSKYSLAKIDILSGLTAEDYKVLEGVVSSYRFAKGDHIVREGDDANTIFIIASGSASISLNLGEGRRKRLSSIGPGFSFGEMALVEGGRRTADVFADDTVVCYVFSVDQINALRETHPQIPMTILANLVRSLSSRLHQANQEIRLLE